jgi:hypothetical protein
MRLPLFFLSIVLMTSHWSPAPVIEPDAFPGLKLTAEEQALFDRHLTMELYQPNEHSRHFIARISAAKDGKDPQPVLCFVFGMEDAEAARKEGKRMAEVHYSRAQAEQFLFAQGWDKYHDRFFARAYVQEGEDAYEKALKKR